MQDGIKQIQNAIKNKLSSYFTEIKEFSNFQSQTQYNSTSHQNGGRTVQEAFDAYRSSLKHIQEHQKVQPRGPDSAQLSLAERYDLLKKQSSSVKMREKNRQLKKQYEDSIKELGKPTEQAQNLGGDGGIEKSIDTVRKTFEEKLKSLKEDFHRNLNEIATSKTAASNSGGGDGSALLASANQEPKVPVHSIYISGQKNAGGDPDDRSPGLSASTKSPHHQVVGYPHSERYRPGNMTADGNTLKPRKKRSFLREDGRGSAQDVAQRPQSSLK